MRKRIQFATILLLIAFGASVLGQESRFRSMMDKHNKEFLDKDPKIGEPLPAVTAYDESKSPVPLTDLKGSHTVLVYGCLT